MTLRSALACAGLALGCSTGDGEGFVRSERLFVEDCWNGAFDLGPTFFAANPHRDTQLLRIQRGGDIEGVSDGLAVLVEGVEQIRASGLGVELPVGLPRGVTPPGIPVEPRPPAPVSLTLYLNDSCQRGNAAVHSLAGSLVFTALFSGDPNEQDARDRLTEASFTATFADPRDRDEQGQVPVERTSVVTGAFRFYFQRGQPAQPFP